MRSGVTSSTGWPSWVGRNPALWCPEREVGKAPPLAPQLNHATAPQIEGPGSSLRTTHDDQDMAFPAEVELAAGAETEKLMRTVETCATSGNSSPASSPLRSPHPTSSPNNTRFLSPFVVSGSGSASSPGRRTKGLKQDRRSATGYTRFRRCPCRRTPVDHR